MSEATVSNNHGINVCDTIIMSDDVYFNNIVTYVSNTTLSVRKMKWWEDNDTFFLVYMSYSALIIISFKFIAFFSESKG